MMETSGHSADADRDALRAARGLGTLITLTLAGSLVLAGIVFATPLAGTIWPALMAGAGVALLARLVHVAARTEVTS